MRIHPFLYPNIDANSTVTVQWYKVSEQPFVGTMWQCMFGVSDIITSLLAVSQSEPPRAQPLTLRIWILPRPEWFDQELAMA